MHEACGHPKVLLQGLQDLHSRLSGNSIEVRARVASILGTDNPDAVSQRIASLSDRAATAIQQVKNERHGDAHYVSRFDAAGLFQSALAKIFSDIPDLQGYGDKNPIWITTLIEGAAHKVQFFFEKVYQDVHGKKLPLWASLIAELSQLPQQNFKAPFPPGIPNSVPLPENAPVVLLGDWGGDNEAAKKIAGIVRKHKASLGIHLGDVYYGGTKSECESFLRLWPLRDSSSDSLSPQPGTSFALNGNHEMYSGGEHYFNVILKAFNQPQSFFCLENRWWRLIGLDTAYANGSLMPTSADDPIATQWNWLLNLLRDDSGKANILLTHHQPVSAHAPEFHDSLKLRTEIEEILAMKDVRKEAIFGWFFGHEHRCALYCDRVTPYNARLVGNGCIPHMVQTERAADEGCTPVAFFNKQETHPGSSVAVSSFAELLFEGPQLSINYCDEDNRTWGTEVWDAENGRLDGIQFIESDGINQ
jgi:hypothetical protein